MKNYDETIETVFQRMEEYKTVQKRKRRMVKRAAASLGCLCLVAAACFGLWKSGVLTKALQGHPGSGGNNHPGSLAETDISKTDKDAFVEKTAKKNAGDLYVVAKDYLQVYDVLCKGYSGDLSWDANGSSTGFVGFFDNGASNNVEDKNSNNSSKPGDASESNYSKTNLQTAGVDESDIIKTDGSYIYTVNEDTIYITDVRGGEMKAAGEIALTRNNSSDRIIEMYVDRNMVNLIVSRKKTTLKTDTAQVNVTAKGKETVATDEFYYFDTTLFTELLTYDVSNPKKPILKGSVTQEGTYQTSRKIGNIVYLFTNQYLSRSNGDMNEATDTTDSNDWIPLVNGEAVAADCIYIPERGSNGLVISSVNIKEPGKVLDDIMIVNDHAAVYVSTTAIYLYKENYNSSSITSITEIAKFSMKQGILDAVGAANVPGTVRDTFAIHEYQGRLRILTTSWGNEGSENNLYLFDEKLESVGKLEGLAQGEQIYSVRFLGTMAYFVTYRNIDPLFAVDLSDEKNPKVLSELKITGFSEYLHFWGEDKLVGIGYETDPETGRQTGLKISMFDISDPTDLKVAGTCVLKNVDYSPALYQYKCVLVDEGENLIGFATETYQDGKEYCSYLLLSWENGSFVERMTEDLGESIYERYALGQYRGIYIDDMFYLACPTKITSYDRTDGYRCAQVLKF